jgi:hypothetical protein
MVLRFPDQRREAARLKRSGFVVPLLVLFLSLLVWRMRPTTGNEERVAGTVVAARATYCEPKKQDGCTGTLVLDTAAESARKVRIPLGTPISDGCEVLSFGELEGRQVVVTEVDEPGGPIALAVLSPAAGCG